MSKRFKIARIILTVLTIAAVVAIFYNSSLSADESTEQSSPLTDMINAFLHSVHIPITLSEKFIRKLAHFTEYTVLGALLGTTVYLYLPQRKKLLLTVLPIGAVIPVIDELIQLSSPGRSCQVSDMLIDFCGVVFALLIVVLIISLKEKRKSKKPMRTLP